MTVYTLCFSSDCKIANTLLPCVALPKNSLQYLLISLKDLRSRSGALRFTWNLGTPVSMPLCGKHFSLDSFGVF